MRASDGFSRALGGYLTASLIWLFSLAVFIPLAAEVSVDAPLKPLIASMFLAATAIEVYGATAGALEYLNSQHVPERLRPILLEAVLAADAVLLVPLLWAVAPVLGGVGLILALTAMLVTAFPHLDELAAFVGRALINLARLLSAQ